MKKATTTAICLAAAASWVMGIGAQTGGMTERQQKSSKDDKTVTLTGCVEEGQVVSTFTLKNVSSMTGTWGTGTGTSGSSGSATSGTSGATGGTLGTSGMMKEVELVPVHGVDLKAHVGHKVEITGMPLDMMERSKDKKDSTGTSGTGATGQGALSGASNWMQHRVKVQSIKHISDTCSGQ